MSDLELIPNPANEEVTIFFPGDPGHWIVSIFSLEGIPFNRFELKQGLELKIDLKAAKPGMYICRAVSPGKAIFSTKLNIVR
jgi:hypothetical protein